MPEFWPPNPSAACSRLLAENVGAVATGQRCAGQGDCMGRSGALAECAIGPDNLAYCSLVSPGKEGDPCIASVDAFSYEPTLTTERMGRYCSAADGLICRPRESSSKVNVCVHCSPTGAIAIGTMSALRNNVSCRLRVPVYLQGPAPRGQT